MSRINSFRYFYHIQIITGFIYYYTVDCRIAASSRELTAGPYVYGKTIFILKTTSSILKYIFKIALCFSLRLCEKIILIKI